MMVPLSSANAYQNISFDIFDTLVTRKTALPTGVFALIQKELKEKHPELPSSLTHHFDVMRRQAEDFARRIHQKPGIQDVTLQQIYDVFKDNLLLSHEEADWLRETELRVEKENLVPIRNNIELLKSLHAAGKNVFCVSDMYLPEATIRQWLCDIDPVFKSIRFYVSSESLKAKYTGDLFRMIQQEQQLQFCHWLHIGDNPHSDVEIPRRLGMDYHRYEYVALEAYENRLVKEHQLSASVQLNVGTAKNLRLLEQMNEKQALGCSLFAPVLLLYARWLIRQSRKLGVKRLYFIARDGYILRKMVDVLIEKQKLDIQTHYIYGSRIAWRLFNGDKTLLAQFFEEYPEKLTPGFIAERLGIPFTQLASFLPRQYQQEKLRLKGGKLREFRAFLLDNEAFLSFLLDFYREKKENLLGYLQQEIDFSDDNFAFVDYRGSGKTADFLADIIREFYPERIKTFFFQMLAAPNNEKSFKYNMFLSLHDDVLLEMFGHAAHGCTVGYEKRDGRYHPVLDGEGAALLEYGFNDIVDGVVRFMDAYSRSANINGEDEDLLLTYMSYFSQLRSHLDPHTARLLGDMPFGFVQSNARQTVYAPPITVSTVLKALFCKKVVIGENKHFRLARTSAPMRWCYKVAQQISLKKLFSLHVSRKKRMTSLTICGMSFHFLRK